MVQAWDFVNAYLLWEGRVDLSAILARRINRCDFSARTTNSLISDGIETVADLVERNEYDLLRLPNFGRKSSQEVKDYLTTFGLVLRDSKWKT